MKKTVFLATLVTAFLGLQATSISASKPRIRPKPKIVLKKDETREYILPKGSIEYVQGIELDENATLHLKGENSPGLKLYDSRPYKIRFSMKDGSKLFSNLENQGTEGSALALEEKSISEFSLEKNSELNSIAHFLGNDAAASKGSALRSNISNFNVLGTLNLESSGIAWSLKSEANIHFQEGSKSLIKGGYTSIFGQNYDIYGSNIATEPKGEAKISFEKGSDTTLVGGHWSLLATEALFKEGSKVKLYGGNGMELLGKGKSTNVIFEKGSEVDILVKGIGFHAGRISGSSKLNFKARNLLFDVNTFDASQKNVEIFHVEKGSILEGNIINSPNAHLKLEQGAKYYVPKAVQTNLTVAGDFYVGPRKAHDLEETNHYEDKIEELDGLSGASVIYFGKDKEGKMADKETNSSNQYYTTVFSNKKYKKDIVLRLEDGNIHLRAGLPFENSDQKNDMLILQDQENHKVRIEGKGKVVLHPIEKEKIKESDVFPLIQEVNIEGDPNFDLAKVELEVPSWEIGPLLFSRKEEQKDNRYIISLAYQGKWSEKAQDLWLKNKAKRIDHYYHQTSTIFPLQKQFLEAKDKNHFWTLSNQEGKKKQFWLGYQHHFENNSLGIFGEMNEQKTYGLAWKYSWKKSDFLALWKQESKKDINASFSFSHEFDWNSHWYVKPMLSATVGKINPTKLEEGDLMSHSKNLKYFRSDLHLEAGYQGSYGKLYTRASLGRNLKGRERIQVSSLSTPISVEKEFDFSQIDRKLGVGAQWKLSSHSLSFEINKKFYDFKSDRMQIEVGYSYTF